jgi:hypothetical protein
MFNKRVSIKCFFILISTLFIIHADQIKAPLMGWSSWNSFGTNISESIIKAQADAMVSKGLDTCGYKYINIDDGFFNGRYSDGTLRIDSTKFPSGFKSLVDYIHNKGQGLKAGFYTDAGTQTCAGWGGDSQETGSGIYGHEVQDAKLVFNTWGFDYIKVDYCGAGWGQHLDEQTRYTLIRKAIDSTGRTDIVYNVCRWLFPGGWVAKIANSWRVANDISATWTRGILRQIDTNTYLSGFVSQGHYNDMDMLEVGNGNLTQTQNRSHFSMWCIMSVPLVLGNNMATMNDSTRSIITNTEAIAINQDTTALQAVLISDDNGGQVWAKRLHGLNSNERAVALFNRDSVNSRTISVKWKDLDLEGSATVRDLWKHSDAGAYDSMYSATVPACGSALLKITGTKSKLQEVFEAENAWMNNFQLTKSTVIQSNQARPAKDANCSGGMKASYLGNNDSNFIEFHNIYANSAETYHVTLYYMSEENRSAKFYVNDVIDTTLTGLNSGSYTKIDSVTIPVSLNIGKNVIKISNSSAYLPDIDKIRVDVNNVTVNSESGRIIRQLNRLKVAVVGNNLTIETLSDNFNVYIYDMSGSVCKISDKRIIPIRELRAGAYSVKVVTKNGTVTKAFIKI